MSEFCCREKYLGEYIKELEIDEGVKKRMLDLYNKKEEEKAQLGEYLRRCHSRMSELELTIIELSTELASAKNIIRELKQEG